MDTMQNTSKQPWYLGIDLGTGSVKTMILDNDFRILHINSGKYNEQILVEQDPQLILNCMLETVRESIPAAGVDPNLCAGLSIGCALHGVLAMDSPGRVLTNLYTWADGRAESQAREIKENGPAEEIYQRTGCPVHGMYWPYKILWIKQNLPQIFTSSTRYTSIKSYILKKLVGEHICDYAVAAGSGFLNVHTLQWDENMLQTAGIQASQLPDLVPPSKTYDGLNPELAKKMGISPRTRLTVGGSDALNSSLGAGAFDSKTATCMVGTSGALRVITDKPLVDPQARSWCYAIDQDQYLTGGAINNGGIALMWLKQMTAGTQLYDFSEGELINLACEAYESAEMQDIFCLPYFAGERSPNWNLNAKATFFGLTMQHTIRHMSLAVLEGVGFRLMQLLEILDQIGVEITDIRISGGITKSDFWMQLVSDILGKDLQVPDCGETSVLGTAMWAILGSGRIQSFPDLAEHIQIKKTYKANQEKHSQYGRKFSRYKELYAALQSFY